MLPTSVPVGPPRPEELSFAFGVTARVPSCGRSEKWSVRLCPPSPVLTSLLPRKAERTRACAVRPSRYLRPGLLSVVRTSRAFSSLLFSCMVFCPMGVFQVWVFASFSVFCSHTQRMDSLGCTRRVSKGVKVLSCSLRPWRWGVPAPRLSPASAETVGGSTCMWCPDLEEPTRSKAGVGTEGACPPKPSCHCDAPADCGPSPRSLSAAEW